MWAFKVTALPAQAARSNELQDTELTMKATWVNGPARPTCHPDPTNHSIAMRRSTRLWGSVFLLVGGFAQAEDCATLKAAADSAKSGFQYVITRQKRENSFATSLEFAGVPCRVLVDHRGRKRFTCFSLTSNGGAAKSLYAAMQSSALRCLTNIRHSESGEHSSVSDMFKRTEVSWLVQVGDADDVKITVELMEDTDSDTDPEDRFNSSFDVTLDR